MYHHGAERGHWDGGIQDGEEDEFGGRDGGAEGDGV